MANKKNILCIVGSLNQTTQLHQISKFLEPDYNIYYSQIYGEGLFYKFIAESGIVDNTVVGANSSFTQKSQEYIIENELNYDYRAKSKREYDLAILSTDLIIPEKIKKIKTVWVQEGMIDPISNVAKFIRKNNLPRYLSASTALNGTSNLADIYFAMSKGYRNYFAKYGTDIHKIFATGVPNFDDIEKLKKTHYEDSDYVLIATSDIRELGGNDNRDHFLEQCYSIVKGRKVIFKPHPNENLERVIPEFKLKFPDAKIVTEPIIDTLIAHCNTLITQFSSSAYVGLVLGKIVYSYFPIEELEENKPIQNHGQSAKIIADTCREFIEFEGDKSQFINQSKSLSAIRNH